MALTYSPYSKTSILPSQGDIQSIINMFLMLKMIGEMNEGKKGKKSLGETPVPMARGQSPLGQNVPPAQPAMPPQGMPAPQPSPMPQQQGMPPVNPQILMMLMQNPQLMQTLMRGMPGGF